jgi:hypothetical protein
LEYLELDRNDELKELPSTIGSLSKLKMLEASSCALIGRIYFSVFVAPVIHADSFVFM